MNQIIAGVAHAEPVVEVLFYAGAIALVIIAILRLAEALSHHRKRWSNYQKARKVAILTAAAQKDILE